MKKGASILQAFPICAVPTGHASYSFSFLQEGALLQVRHLNCGYVRSSPRSLFLEASFAQRVLIPPASYMCCTGKFQFHSGAFCSRVLDRKAAAALITGSWKEKAKICASAVDGGDGVAAYHVRYRGRSCGQASRRPSSAERGGKVSIWPQGFSRAPVYGPLYVPRVGGERGSTPAAVGTRARRGSRRRRGRFFSCRRWRGPLESRLRGPSPILWTPALSPQLRLSGLYATPFPPRPQGTMIAFVRPAANGVRPLYASPPEINA